jgi:hypothetical protein
VSALVDETGLDVDAPTCSPGALQAALDAADALDSDRDSACFQCHHQLEQARYHAQLVLRLNVLMVATLLPRLITAR